MISTLQVMFFEVNDEKLDNLSGKRQMLEEFFLENEGKWFKAELKLAIKSEKSRVYFWEISFLQKLLKLTLQKLKRILIYPRKVSN